MNRLLLAFCVVMCCTSSLGDGPRRIATRELTDEVIVPTLDDAANRAAELATAAERFVQLRNAIALRDLQLAWRSARVPWKESEVFAFGPARDDRLAVAIDQSPIDPAAIEAAIGGTDTIDAAFVGNLGANKKGFHAIEYLVFDPNTVVLFDASPRRGLFLVAVAQHLAATARALADAWSNGYATTLSQPGNGNAEYATIQSVVDTIANETVVLSQTVADIRIGKPSGAMSGGTPEPDLEESGPSDNSIDDMLASLRGLRNAYYGSRDGTPGKGIGALVAAHSVATDLRVRRAIADARVAVSQIPRPYRTAILDGRPEVAAALAEVDELHTILATEVIGTLGATLKFSGNDGD